MVNVLVGISSAELSRYVEFYGSIFSLNCPEGTIIRPARGINIAENRNILAEEALRIGAQWLLYLDDDGVLPPNTLMRLLDHNKDIVSALYLQRSPPFTPIMYSDANEKGHCLPRLLKPQDKGIIKVKGVGAGCLLVRCSVFKTMKRPWWRLGQIDVDRLGDDLDFCRRAISDGFDIWCDLDTGIGHKMSVTVWPSKNEAGEWITALGDQNQTLVEYPATIAN